MFLVIYWILSLFILFIVYPLLRLFIIVISFKSTALCDTLAWAWYYLIWLRALSQMSPIYKLLEVVLSFSIPVSLIFRNFRFIPRARFFYFFYFFYFFLFFFCFFFVFFCFFFVFFYFYFYLFFLFFLLFKLFLMSFIVSYFISFVLSCIYPHQSYLFCLLLISLYGVYCLVCSFWWLFPSYDLPFISLFMFLHSFSLFASFCLRYWVFISLSLKISF